MGRGGIYRLSYRIQTRSKRSTTSYAKRSKPKGSFPSGDAARKLVYLALQNAVPAWTRTRNWTTALLAFKIHFGDRVPDTAN